MFSGADAPEACGLQASDLLTGTSGDGHLSVRRAGPRPDRPVLASLGPRDRLQARRRVPLYLQLVDQPRVQVGIVSARESIHVRGHAVWIARGLARLRATFLVAGPL